MTDRRVPPPRAQAPTAPAAVDESTTILVRRPELSDAEPKDSVSEGAAGPGRLAFADSPFADSPFAHQAPTAAIEVAGTAEISVIEAEELSVSDERERRPAPSDAGFRDAPRQRFFDAQGVAGVRGLGGELDDELDGELDGDGAMFDEATHPATEVLTLGFSDAGQDSVTPPVPAPPPPAAPPPTVPAPVEVLKWKAGTGQPPPRPLPPPGSPAGPPVDERRARPGVVPLPRSDGGAPPPGATRVDVGRGSAGRAGPLDVDELRRTLEDAERLLKTAKAQGASLDLEARGMNAQLAAALHRVAEALAMLRR